MITISILGRRMGGLALFYAASLVALLARDEGVGGHLVLGQAGMALCILFAIVGLALFAHRGSRRSTAGRA